MAKSITFTFAVDVEGQKTINEFCTAQRFGREAMEGESKEDFFIRKTLQWWFDHASQGKAKMEIQGWRAEYEKMVITTTVE